MISSASDRGFHGFHILDPYERFIPGGSYLLVGKMWENVEKRTFFRADMAGLRKCHTGGYGRIGVYQNKKKSQMGFGACGNCSKQASLFQG